MKKKKNQDKYILELPQICEDDENDNKEDEIEKLYHLLYQNSLSLLKERPIK